MGKGCEKFREEKAKEIMESAQIGGDFKELPELLTLPQNSLRTKHLHGACMELYNPEDLWLDSEGSEDDRKNISRHFAFRPSGAHAICFQNTVKCNRLMDY